MSETVSPLENNPEYERLLAEEGLVLEALEALCAFMEQQGVTRAELARRLGTSRANVTQLLRGRNVTLRTLAAAVHVLGGEARLVIRPCGVPAPTASTSGRIRDVYGALGAPQERRLVVPLRPVYAAPRPFQEAA